MKTNFRISVGVGLVLGLSFGIFQYSRSTIRPASVSQASGPSAGPSVSQTSASVHADIKAQSIAANSAAEQRLERLTKASANAAANGHTDHVKSLETQLAATKRFLEAKRQMPSHTAPSQPLITD